MRVCVGTYEHLIYGLEQQKGSLVLSPFFADEDNTGAIRSLANNGKVLVAGTSDDLVKVYSLSQLVTIGSLDLHRGAVTGLYLRQDKLLSVSVDGSLSIARSSDWNQMSRALAGKRGNRTPLRSLEVHSSGKLGISLGGAKDCRIIIWDLIRGKYAACEVLKAKVSGLVWAGDVYVMSIGNFVEIRGGDGEVATAIDCEAEIVSMKGASSNSVVCGCADGRVWIVSVDGTKSLVGALEGRVRAIDAIEDPKLGLVVSAGSSEGYVGLWSQGEILGMHHSGMRITSISIIQ